MAAAMMPITFCESLSPWPVLNNADETSLQAFEPDFCTEMRHIAATIEHDQRYDEGYQHADERSEEDEGGNLDNHLALMAPKPFAMIAAPAKPPMRGATMTTGCLSTM